MTDKKSRTNDFQRRRIFMREIAKSFLCILCVAAIILSVPVVLGVRAEAAEGLNLAEMQIVLPASPTAVERTAANELYDYIGKITGKSVRVVSEGENSGAGIYIGATEYAKAKGVTYPTEGDTNREAWAIQAIGDSLVLCGAETRGVLYAVYHLLEDVLGVRWWNLWEQYVPIGSAIVPVDYADSGVPVMEYREIFVGAENSTDYPFYVGNRINGNTTHIPASYGGSEVYGLPAHVHTFNRYFNKADFDAHPQWFSMDENGQRVSDRQLCLTNQELKDEFATRLVNNVKKNPDGIFAVCPNDNKYLCDCSACKKEIEAYGTSGYVLDFVNEMARAVAAAGYPETSIEMLVYWMYVDEPKGGVRPEPNVTIRFADNYTDLLHGVNHPNNAESLRRLRIWSEIASNDLYYWQYVVNYNNNGIFPTMFHYGDDFTTLAELGVNGWFAEQEQCINADFWDMKLWLIAKLMEKPVSGEEYTALMDEFIYGYYGEEAGKHIRDYLYYMHEKAEATNVSQDFGAHIIGAEWLKVEDILAGNKYFEKAFDAVGDDTLLQRRLRAARSGFDRVAYENYQRWQEEADEAGLTLPFTRRELGKRVCYTMSEQLALRGGYDGDAQTFFARYDQYTDDLPALPEELTDVAREHVWEYTGSDCRLTKNYAIVEDAASPVGTAIFGDAAGRDTGNSAGMLEYGDTVIIALYNPNVGDKKIEVIARLPLSDIFADQGYQLYSFPFTVPKIGDGGYVYLFNDWGVQIPLMATELKELEGRTVEICLSMKTEGTKFYIDRVLILPEADQRAHNYVNDYESGRSICQICGDVIEFDIEGSGNTKPEGLGQVMLMMVVSAFVEVAGFALLMFLIIRKKRRR